MRKRSLKTQKQKTWEACSKYVRLRDADNEGYTRCYTCGVRKPYRDMQAAHAVQGRGNSILFETDGIRSCCASCNVWAGGRLDVFIPKLIDEIGRERYDELLALKGQPRKWTVEELKELEDYYRREIDEIAKA